MRKMWGCVLGVCSVWASAVQAQGAADLGRIVVTPQRMAMSDARGAANVSVISRDDIEASSALTIADVLRSTAGLQVVDYGYTARNALDLRGYGETALSNTLILIDGRRINPPDLSGPDLLQIPLDAVERIEIVRGSGSVLYGDNASGGVINVITREPGEKAEVEAEAAFGNRGTERQSVNVSGGRGAWDYVVSARRFDTTGYRANGDLQTLDGDAKVGVQITDRARMTISAGWHEDKYGMPGGMYLSQMSSLGRRGTTTPSDNAETTDRFAEMTFSGMPWGEEAGRWETSVSRRNRDVLTYFSPGPSTHNAVDTTGVTSRYLWDTTWADHQVSLIAGVDHYADDNPIYKPGSTDIVITRKTLGFYGQAEVELLQDVFWKGGARHETADYVFDNRITAGYDAKGVSANVYESAVRWQYRTDSNVFASYSESFRFPATDEYYSSFTGLLSSSLKPQKGKTYSMGIKHSMEGKILLSAVPYLTKTQDEIYYDPLVTWSNTNIDRTKRTGVETGLEIDILSFVPVPGADKLRWFGSCTLQNPETDSGVIRGKRIPGVARHLASTGLDTRWGERLGISMQARYTGSRFMTSDWDNDLEKIKSSLVVDGRISWDQRSATFFLEGNNIFSYRYFSAAADYGSGYYYPAPGRSVLAGVKYRF